MFVEDEISRTIPRIAQLFGKYLSETEKAALADAENNPMGANGDDIRQILADNCVLEVFDSFPEALKHIRGLSPETLADYDMFILDRNLTGGPGYTPQEAKQINKNFDDIKYNKREGDYLALQLHLQGCPIKEKVFFYSAYKTMSFAATEIEQMVEYGTFFEDNFFDKGKPDALIELINNQKRASLFSKYRDIFGIISNTGMGTEEAMMRILLEAEKDDANLTMDFRTMIDTCLDHIKKYNDFWFVNPEPQNTIGETIDKLHRAVVPEHIRIFFAHINKIINTYVAHISDYDYKMPSHYTVKALSCEVMEIIHWIGENCR